MNEVAPSPVPLGSSLLDQVWELYRKNSATLGFLPRGALDEFAHAGRVLAATRGDELLGYAAWRRSREEAVLVHLCVAEAHRGSNCSEVLLRAMIEHCRQDASIRLRCRKDYIAANRVWPRLGFAVDREVVGRGADQVPLLEWRRKNLENSPLLQAIQAATPRATHVVALDANVFFDVMNPAAAHHEESHALLADWLDDVDVCVTRELRNEVARQDDDGRRQAASAYLRQFPELAAHPDLLVPALAEIAAVLPPAVTDSDESDRRQLVHAWKGGASYFATRDGTLLDHAGDLQTVTGLIVLRPTDVVARLQGDFLGTDYAPVRLQGTQVERRTARSEEELLPFQRFMVRESKAGWLQTVRAARAVPDRCSVEVVGARGEAPRVALAVDRSPPESLHLSFLRALSGSLTGTILRRVLANVVESAREQNRSQVTIDDPGPGEVRDALEQVGFEVVRGGRLVRHTLSGLVTRDAAPAIIRERLPDVVLPANPPAEELEARFWPLKVLGAEIPSFLVPIKPLWAAALFDRHLASQELFGVPEGPALALENVYYSASNIHIPAGSRILWYVSRDASAVRAVRAVSTSLGTDVDAATRLSRRYHRLGVFRWQDILQLAKGDPQGQLRAYRFVRTELLEWPVRWRQLEDLILRYMGTRNRLASPLRVPEALFEELYRAGTEGSV
jgi:GNAT superfamily N-acetyltransferase